MTGCEVACSCMSPSGPGPLTFATLGQRGCGCPGFQNILFHVLHADKSDSGERPAPSGQNTGMPGANWAS